MRGQVDAFRRAAPVAARVEAYHTEGVAMFRATFVARAEETARAQCDATVLAYLRGAPRLPVVMEPVAHVTMPCGLCPGPWNAAADRRARDGVTDVPAPPL